MPASNDLEKLFIRLYLDRHIKPQLAEDLRTRGFDALTTQDARLETAPDEDQLAFAAQEHRALLTFNIRDFAALHEQWQAAQRGHWGIVVSQQLGTGTMASS